MDMMSLLEKWSRSLFILPREYKNIQPHHVLVLYGVVQLVSCSGLYKKLSHQILSILSQTAERLIPLVYMGIVPDFVVRWGIRIQLRDRLATLRQGGGGGAAADHHHHVEMELADKLAIVQKLHTMPIAIHTADANDQHYEVPAAFYDLCLGPRKKYSSGLWPTPTTTFEESEVHMLDLYCDRAGVVDGMSIVDLGCGWGSLTLHLAEKYPNCKITSISNSHSQKEYIMSTASKRGYNVNNIHVVTCNVADDQGALAVVQDNDLVMTVEMFEHMKNYNQLLEKVHGFLKPGGKLFVHIFTHRDFCYHFEDGWMSDHFFSGGTMPSDDLLLYFAQDFAVEHHWRVSGVHYEKTSNGWLNYLDTNWRNGTLAPVLQQAYGEGKEREWYVHWRLFFLACAELWGLDNGQEWIVSHYLFVRR